VRRPALRRPQIAYEERGYEEGGQKDEEQSHYRDAVFVNLIRFIEGLRSDGKLAGVWYLVRSNTCVRTKTHPQEVRLRLPKGFRPGNAFHTECGTDAPIQNKRRGHLGDRAAGGRV
jgi:hypothetical protein